MTKDRQAFWSSINTTMSKEKYRKVAIVLAIIIFILSLAIYPLQKWTMLWNIFFWGIIACMIAILVLLSKMSK